MKTLGALKFFVCKQKNDSVVWRSQEIGLRKQQPTGFRLHQNHISVRDGFSFSISLSRHKFIQSVSAAASSDQTNVESEEIQTIDSDQPKTVRVRFKLYRECAFGEQFLIVGDDPIFGLWDPSDGVLLNWSEGHLWTADMDTPSGKVIKYKFILKGIAGDILWQPGPDRVLKTWDTDKTITVFEDWDNPEIQTIVEEEFVADLNEVSLIDSDLLIVAENLIQPILNEGADNVVIEELPNVNGHINNHAEMLLSESMVAENVSEESEEIDSSISDNGSGLMSVTDQKEEDNLLSSKDERTIEGVPVLVPGLGLMPLEETQEVVAEEENVTLASEDSTEPECNSIAQLKDEHVSASVHSTETSSTEAMMDDEREQMCVAEKTETDVLQSDMQWGRRALQKFLANLGFQMTM